MVADQEGQGRTTDLLVNFAMYWDLWWVLEEDQAKQLLSLPVEAFGDVPSRASVFPLPGGGVYPRPQRRTRADGPTRGREGAAYPRAR